MGSKAISIQEVELNIVSVNTASLLIFVASEMTCQS